MTLMVFSKGKTLNIASWVERAGVEVVANAQGVGDRHLGLHAPAAAHGVGGDVAQRGVAAGRVVAPRDVRGRVGEDRGRG